MGRYDFEWEKKGTHEEHLSVLDYKKQERVKEVNELENQIARKKDDISVLKTTYEIREKEAKERLNAYISSVVAVERYATEYSGAPEQLLPEPGRMESAKTYREIKAVPFFQKLIGRLKEMYATYCRLKIRYNDLVSNYNKVLEEKEHLKEENIFMEYKIGQLEETEKDYKRLRATLGEYMVDQAVEEAKIRERIKRDELKKRNRSTR